MLTRQKTRGLAVVAALMPVAIAIPAAAQPAAPATPTATPTMMRWSLANGLEVAVVPMDRAPVVAVQLWYHVGSKDEPGNKRGTAHMFEHLMYKGSVRLPPDAHTNRLRQLGGYSNALTTEDATAFHNTVPSDYFETVLELEAERMRNLMFLPKYIGAEREVLKGEVQRNLRNPLYNAVVRFFPVAFDGHPYSWTSGGVLAEVDAIDAATLKSFYDRYYVPNNALLVIVGDVDSNEVKAAVDRHFSSIPRGEPIPRPNPPGPLDKPARVTSAPSPLGFVLFGYRIPGAADPDIHALQVLSLILARGESSRLFKRLVGGKVAVEAGGQAVVREQPGLFMIFGAFTKAAAADGVEAALAAEIDKVRRFGVTAVELTRARNQARAALTQSVQRTDGLAQQIGSSWAHTGDPNRYLTDIAKLGAVTGADIKRVANKYLSKNARALMVIPVAIPQAGGN